MTVAELQPYLPELMLRGACAGVLTVFAASLLRSVRRRPGRRTALELLAILFAVGTAAYALISTPVGLAYPPAFRSFLVVLATLNSVFFWWFATALFDDEFIWRPWRLAPFAALMVLVSLRLAGSDWVEGSAHLWIQQAMVLAMTAHALWLALAHRGDDLVEPRRRFRLLFCGLVGMAGIVIALTELWLGDAPPPLWLTGAHAVALFGLTTGFGSWLMQPSDLLTAVEERGSSKSSGSDASQPGVDLAFKARLEALMRDGAYREEGLTVAALAARLGCPEYRLRRLINQALGYRNFNAFLNAYRIEEAKALLSDPEKAGTQIAQIALALGYGSIAPFNRAFKAALGETPSAYRDRVLAMKA